MKAASRPAALSIAGRRIMVERPAKRGMSLPLWGWWKTLDIAYHPCSGSNFRLRRSEYTMADSSQKIAVFK
jgi:hypothetical protein